MKKYEPLTIEEAEEMSAVIPSAVMARVEFWNSDYETRQATFRILAKQMADGGL